MAYSNTWNATFITLPADTEDISQGADRIRDFKVAIQERMQKDHYWDPAGTDADHGEHEAVTLREQAAAPTNVANKGFVYTKEAGGKTELFFMDEDGNEVQLTSGGSINTSSASVPSGTKMWVYADAAPSGWTYESGITDRVLAVKNSAASGYNTTGGTEVGSWSHNHSGSAASAGAHTHCAASSGSPCGSYGFGWGNPATTSNGAHSHSVSVNNNTSFRPYAAVGIICSKD